MGKTALTSRARPSKCLAVEVAPPLALSRQPRSREATLVLRQVGTREPARSQHCAATCREPGRALRPLSALPSPAPGLCLGWKSFEVCAWQAGP